MKRLILQEKAWGSERMIREGLEAAEKDTREGKP